MDAVATPYSDALQDLYEASGDVQQQINNGNDDPTPTQSDFLNYLTGTPTGKFVGLGLAAAIKLAASDSALPAMPVPGTEPGQ